jgi:hypothetical protein
MVVSRRFLLLCPLTPAAATLRAAFAVAAEITPEAVIERFCDDARGHEGRQAAFLRGAL